MKVLRIAALVLVGGLCACAGRGGIRVEVQEHRIAFFDKIRFDSSTARIRPESHRLLDAIANSIKERPDIQKIRIAGHTDNVGPSKINLRLSYLRASAVRDYLVRAGVAKHRLAAEGYGERRPVASNKTAAGREKNRRVEFVIIRRSR